MIKAPNSSRIRVLGESASGQGGAMAEPAFYSSAYLAPPRYPEHPVRPAGARFDSALGEFVLPYEMVRSAPAPDATLLEFLQSTYDAAADLGAWDRAALERGHDPAPTIGLS